MNTLSLSLGVELAPAVRVNAVLPGIIGTEMNKEHFADHELETFVRTTHPFGFGCPEDVADTVEFLVSDRACWITVQEIVVVGGGSVFPPPGVGEPDPADSKGNRPLAPEQL